MAILLCWDVQCRASSGNTSLSRLGFKTASSTYIQLQRAVSFPWKYSCTTNTPAMPCAASKWQYCSLRGEIPFGMAKYQWSQCLKANNLQVHYREIYLKVQSVPHSKHRLGYKNHSLVLSKLSVLVSVQQHSLSCVRIAYHGNKDSGIELTLYCTDRVSSCNIYAVQQDTQGDFNEWVYSALMLARHVSDLTGPSSGASFTRQIGMW